MPAVVPAAKELHKMLLSLLLLLLCSCLFGNCLNFCLSYFLKQFTELRFALAIWEIVSLLESLIVDLKSLQTRPEPSAKLRSWLDDHGSTWQPNSDIYLIFPQYERLTILPFHLLVFLVIQNSSFLLSTILSAPPIFHVMCCV